MIATTSSSAANSVSQISTLATHAVSSVWSIGGEYFVSEIYRCVLFALWSKYYVIDANEVVLELSKEKIAKVGDKSNFFVNRNMFKQWGAIAD
jgi:hypothetical protein